MLAGALVIGACLPWVLVSLFTLLQRRTPLALQGRVYSAFDTLIGLPQTISIAAGAGLIAFVDYRLLLIFSAVMGVIAAVYLLTREEQRSVSRPRWRGEPGGASLRRGGGAVTSPDGLRSPGTLRVLQISANRAALGLGMRSPECPDRRR